MRIEALFNYGWEFVKLPIGSLLSAAVESSDWKRVDLPHDWLIYDTADLYGDAAGFYHKTFTLDKKEDKTYLINFDGVYMDSTLYVNGKEAGTHRYGYSAFEYDITDFLTKGQNTLYVEIRHKSPNTRWYSGAGIFRDVVLKEVSKTHIATDGIYISSEKLSDKQWKVLCDVELVGPDCNLVGKDAALDLPEGYTLGYKCKLLPSNPEDCGSIMRPCPEAEDFVVKDSSSGDNCSVCQHPCDMRNEVRVSDFIEEGRTASFCIDNPFVWDVTSPNRYELTVELSYQGTVIDIMSVVFGLRTVEFTPDKGMILNGRRVKLNGVCEHHDLGCLGAAFNRDAMRRQFALLKEMGVNAVRTSHNMPARAFMELADEMGILVDSEAFDMWRRAKTEYDYARFFEDNFRDDIRSWVRRDRSHPSIIMWSVGNEIYDCHADESAVDLVAELRANVELHDYRLNGKATFGSNYMPWEGAQKCADKLGLVGYNYAEKLYDQHHADHPDWCIYGSETSSTVQSRGIYHFPLKASVMADDDEQCSVLGNCTTSWGAKSTEYVIIEDRKRDFSAGTFLWSGFDYIGEPTPYHTKNSYFGMLDTAGFAKDTFYMYKAAWTDPKKSPFVHIFPYWDFNEGQLIDVRVTSNCKSIELFFNGESLGRRELDHVNGDVIAHNWQIPYHKGELKALAYAEDGSVLATDVQASYGDSASIVCKEFTNKAHPYRANGKDIIFLEISTLDKDGNYVANAKSRMNIKVKGAACLVGLDNGDSTDFEQFKCNSRRLFSGKLLAMLQTGSEPGKVEVCISSPGMEDCVFTTEVIEDTPLDNAFFEDAGSLSPELKASECLDTAKDNQEDIPVRKIELISDGSQVISADKKQTLVKAKIHPDNAVCSGLVWKAVSDYAADSNLVKLTVKDNEVMLYGMGDGEFRIRCMTSNGSQVLRCISSLEYKCQGLGKAYIDPYNFVLGCTFTDSKGDVGNGNEKGVATARGEDCYIGYQNIDFGDYGSDEITLPIFTLTNEPYKIAFWTGVPGQEGSELLLDGIYEKPTIWNVYQPETYKFNKRLKGIKDLYITASDKYHIKGFSFTKYDKAFSPVNAAENDSIYGDTYTSEEVAVTGIGNNVTLEFNNFNFGQEGAGKLVICGRAQKDNSVHLKYVGEETGTHLIEFKAAEDYTEQEFEIPVIKGNNKISFVFLPGSCFDFKYFRFVKR